MKLIKEDIKNIDAFLKQRGIAYMDVRYELMDHLISEYEQIENYPDLKSFLIKRLPWCKKVAKEKQKSLHWGYQKALWKRFLSFFKNPRFYAIALPVLWVFYELSLVLAANSFKKTIVLLFIGLMLTHLIFYFSPGMTWRKGKMLSMTYLMNIFALPQALFYVFNAFNSFSDISIVNSYVFLTYISFAILLYIAAMIEVYYKRKHILKEYEFLKVYLA